MSFSTSMLPMGATNGVSNLAAATGGNPLASTSLLSSAGSPQLMTNRALGGGGGQGGGIADLMGQLLPMMLMLLKAVLGMVSQLFGGQQGQQGQQAPGQQGQQGQQGPQGQTGMRDNGPATMGSQGAGNCKPCDNSKPTQPQGQQDSNPTMTYPQSCPPPVTKPPQGQQDNTYKQPQGYEPQGYQPASKPCPPPPPVCPPPPPECPPQGTPTPSPTPSYPPDKPEKPPEKKPPELPKYQGGTDGRIWGDPHFRGFDNEQYTIKGQDGKVYNLLQDKNVTFNGQFEKWGNGTVVARTGLQVGDHEIGWDPSKKLNAAPTIDGKPMKPGDRVDLGNGQYALWTMPQNAPARLEVVTSEYKITQQAMHMPGDINNINTDVKLRGDIFADNVKPTGLLGITADGKGKKNAPTEAMASQFMVTGGLFSENFKRHI